ncbi:unnamed protein product, partial [Closterium sp. NIES-54]
MPPPRLLRRLSALRRRSSPLSRLLPALSSPSPCSSVAFASHFTTLQPSLPWISPHQPLSTASCHSAPLLSPCTHTSLDVPASHWSSSRLRFGSHHPYNCHISSFRSHSYLLNARGFASDTLLPLQIEASDNRSSHNESSHNASEAAGNHSLSTLNTWGRDTEPHERESGFERSQDWDQWRGEETQIGSSGSVDADSLIDSAAAVGAGGGVNSAAGAVGAAGWLGGWAWLGVPVDAVTQMVSSIQATTGAPWWLTLIGSTLALRLILFPLTWHQMSISSQLAALGPKHEHHLSARRPGTQMYAMPSVVYQHDMATSMGAEAEEEVGDRWANHPLYSLTHSLTPSPVHSFPPLPHHSSPTVPLPFPRPGSGMTWQQAWARRQRRRRVGRATYEKFLLTHSPSCPPPPLPFPAPVPPPFPLPGSNMTWQQAWALRQRRRRQLNAPSALWLLAAPAVQVWPLLLCRYGRSCCAGMAAPAVQVWPLLLTSQLSPTACWAGCFPSPSLLPSTPQCRCSPFHLPSTSLPPPFHLLCPSPPSPFTTLPPHHPTSIVHLPLLGWVLPLAIAASFSSSLHLSFLPPPLPLTVPHLLHLSLLAWVLPICIALSDGSIGTSPPVAMPVPPFLSPTAHPSCFSPTSHTPFSHYPSSLLTLTLPPSSLPSHRFTLPHKPFPQIHLCSTPNPRSVPAQGCIGDDDTAAQDGCTHHSICISHPAPPHLPVLVLSLCPPFAILQFLSLCPPFAILQFLSLCPPLAILVAVPSLCSSFLPVYGRVADDTAGQDGCTHHSICISPFLPHLHVRAFSLLPVPSLCSPCLSLCPPSALLVSPCALPLQGRALALRSPTIRQALGLPTIAQMQAMQQQHTRTITAAASAAAASKGAPNSDVSIPGGTGSVGQLVSEQEIARLTDPHALLVAAAQLKAAGSADLAACALRRVLEIDQSASSAWLGLGQMHSGAGRWVEAAECFSQAINHSKERADVAVQLAAHLGAGVALAQQSRPLEAKALLQVAAETVLEGEHKRDPLNRRRHAQAMLALA